MNRPRQCASCPMAIVAVTMALLLGACGGGGGGGGGGAASVEPLPGEAPTGDLVVVHGFSGTTLDGADTIIPIMTPDGVGEVFVPGGAAVPGTEISGRIEVLLGGEGATGARIVSDRHHEFADHVTFRIPLANGLFAATLPPGSIVPVSEADGTTSYGLDGDPIRGLIREEGGARFLLIATDHLSSKRVLVSKAYRKLQSIDGFLREDTWIHVPEKGTNTAIPVVDSAAYIRAGFTYGGMVPGSAGLDDPVERRKRWKEFLVDLMSGRRLWRAGHLVTAEALGVESTGEGSLATPVSVLFDRLLLILEDGGILSRAGQGVSGGVQISLEYWDTYLKDPASFAADMLKKHEELKGIKLEGAIGTFLEHFDRLKAVGALGQKTIEMSRLLLEILWIRSLAWEMVDEGLDDLDRVIALYRSRTQTDRLDLPLLAAHAGLRTHLEGLWNQDTSALLEYIADRLTSHPLGLILETRSFLSDVASGFVNPRAFLPPSIVKLSKTRAYVLAVVAAETVLEVVSDMQRAHIQAKKAALAATFASHVMPARYDEYERARIFDPRALAPDGDAYSLVRVHLLQYHACYLYADYMAERFRPEGLLMKVASGDLIGHDFLDLVAGLRKFYRRDVNYPGVVREQRARYERQARRIAREYDGILVKSIELDLATSGELRLSPGRSVAFGTVHPRSAPVIKTVAIENIGRGPIEVVVDASGAPGWLHILGAGDFDGVVHLLPGEYTQLRLTVLPADITGAELARITVEDVTNQDRQELTVSVMGLADAGPPLLEVDESSVDLIAGEGEFSIRNAGGGGLEVRVTSLSEGLSASPANQVGLGPDSTATVRLHQKHEGSFTGVIRVEADDGTGSPQVRLVDVTSDPDFDAVTEFRVLVIDEQSGTPVPYAIVRSFHNGSFDASAVAGADGRALLPLDESGVYSILAKAEGYAARKVSKEVSYLGPYSIEIPLPEEKPTYGRIAGKVTDVDGLPIENGKVVLSSNVAAPEEVRTDAWGRYAFDELESGTYTLYFDASGHAPRVSKAPLDPGESRTVSLSLGRATGRLDVRVADEEGNGVQSTVTLKQGDEIVRDRVTDAKGVLRIDDLPVGTYFVLVASSGYRSVDSDDFGIYEGELQVVRLELPDAAGDLELKVVDAVTSKGLGHVRVVLTGIDKEYTRTGTTKDDGTVVFQGLPPGRASVLASKEYWRNKSYSVVLVDGKETFEQFGMNQGMGSITVKVTDEATDKPVSGADVVARWLGKEEKATTGASGEASFADLPQGTQISLTISLEGYLSVVDVKVTIGDAVPKVTALVELTPLVVGFEGKVTDLDGKALSGARVTATGGGKTHEYKTGTDGKWSISGLVHGTTYTLKAALGSYHTSNELDRKAESNVRLTGISDFKLEKQGSGGGSGTKYTATVMVRDKNQDPVDGASVKLQKDGVDYTSSVTANKKGNASFSVPDGTYKAVITAKGYEGKTTGEIVVKGKDKTYTVALKASGSGGSGPKVKLTFLIRTGSYQAPVPNVVIQVKDKNGKNHGDAQKTNKKGNATFEVPSGTYGASIVATGYKTKNPNGIVVGKSDKYYTVSLIKSK